MTAAIRVNRADPCTKHCFKCGKSGHIASSCSSRSEPTCYNCGKKGNVFHYCWSQENGQGMSQIFKMGVLPGTDQCSTRCTCSNTCTQQSYSLYTWTEAKAHVTTRKNKYKTCIATQLSNLLHTSTLTLKQGWHIQ